jgi:hypothetical protein
MTNANETLTIPARLVPHVRDGAMYLLGIAADDIGVQTDRAKPELQGPLQRFDAARALLEALPAVAGMRARIDGAQAVLLREALIEDTDVTRGMAESARNQGEVELAEEYAADLPAMETFTASLCVARGVR